METNPFMLDEEESPFNDPSVQTSLTNNSYAAVDARISIEQTTANIPSSKREADLIAREAALDAREKALNAQQQQLNASGIHPPNWPFFYPFIYLDIDVEIPEAYRSQMVLIYRYWLATVGLLLWNVVTCFTILISPGMGDISKAASDFGTSLFYALFITFDLANFRAASLYSWYRPVYSGYMKENSLYFTIFMLFFGFHILYCAYMLIGFSGSGSGGIINLLVAFSSGRIVAGVFCCIDTAGWAVGLGYGVWIYKTVHAHYKSAGHSIESARNDIVGIGVRNGGVGVVASAAMA